MQNTLYVTFKSLDSIDLDEVNKIIKDAVRKVQSYVPGYRQVTRATIVGNELMVTIQVKGNGDYLPAYSGNLDIINSAAIEAARELEASGWLA
jgi:acetaldehyde dehydrogenase